MKKESPWLRITFAVVYVLSCFYANAQQLKGAFTSTWLGNTYGGRNDAGGDMWFTPSDPLDDWVQNYIDCMTVTADGTCYTTSGWDEAGRTKGIYKDGDVLGNGAGVGNCGSAGGFTIIGTTISGNGKTITNAGKPAAIAMGDGALAGKLLVADNGVRKQILVYDVLGTGAPTIVETIGANGGIASSFNISYALPAATNSLAFASGTYGSGVYHPLKLWGLTGVGCDNQGRVFASHSEQGSGIRCFKKVNGNWILDWKVENYCFVDNVFYDEKTDAVDVYGVQEHYKMNFDNIGAGKEWSIYGYSLDVDKYPEDPRGIFEIKAGGEHKLTSTVMREINGIRYIWTAGMTCQPPNIFKYKLGTEVAVPCGMFMGRQDRIYNLDFNFWWPPNKPAWAENTTSYWEDFNNNGKYEANEYTDQSHVFREGDFIVDKSGNIWQGQNPITVWNASFLPNGNIHYSSNNLTKHTITGIPSIGKIVYQEDKDRLVLLTATCRNITSGKVYVVDNWSKGNRAARYVSTLWGPNQSSWSAAGDYAFEVGWGTRAKVWVTDLRDGSLAGTMSPSHECGGLGRTGWVDIAAGLQAYQRKNGEYLIFVEDDGLGRVMLYRWCESGACETVTPYPSGASGTVTAEYWNGLEGESVPANMPSASANVTSILRSIEIPHNVSDNYLVRVKGYIIPSTSGIYNLYIASNDKGELWLSGSSNPADKTKIASVFWPVMSRDWNPNPEQKSANTALIAGTKYYFEAIMKQSDGSDNLSIGWTGPGISTITVIGGENIDRYVSGSTAADKNIISQKSIKLHPNPAKTELYISGNLSENTNYEITSIEWKSLQTGVFRGGSVSISNLMSGIYLIKIKTEAGENVQRFVKE